MKRVEKYIKPASEAIWELVTDKENRVIPRLYASQLNAFAPDVIRMGLKIAFKVYQEKSDKVCQEKSEGKVIQQIAKTAGYDDWNTLFIEVERADNASLRLYTKKMIDASIALKWMSRTYNIPKNTE